MKNGHLLSKSIGFMLALNLFGSVHLELNQI